MLWELLLKFYWRTYVYTVCGKLQSNATTNRFHLNFYPQCLKQRKHIPETDTNELMILFIGVLTKALKVRSFVYIYWPAMLELIVSSEDLNTNSTTILNFFLSPTTLVDKVFNKDNDAILSFIYIFFKYSTKATWQWQWRFFIDKWFYMSKQGNLEYAF